MNRSFSTPMPGRHRANSPMRRPAAFVAIAASAGVLGALSGSVSAQAQPTAAAASPAAATTELERALAGRASAAQERIASLPSAQELAEEATREQAQMRADRAAAQRQAIAKRKAAAKAKRVAAAKRAAAAKRWVSPIKNPNLTSSFGPRWGRLHAGLDFGAVVGTPLHALSTGTVTKAGWGGGYGQKLEITYWDGTVSYFAHMSQIDVQVGQKVAPGTYVGKTGNTGNSTGPHLHLEIHPGGGDPVDPHGWLAKHGLKL